MIKNELFGGVSSGKVGESESEIEWEIKGGREKASERWSEGERNREIGRQRALAGVCVWERE